MFDHGYALLIGVNQSEQARLALPTVANDIIALKGILTDPRYCGYLPDNVKVVTGSDATRGGILESLFWLKQKLQADTSEEQTAVVYYSGHGHVEPNGDAFLLPYDVGRPLAQKSLPARDFAEQIQQIQPRRLLTVLDCCHAAAMNVKDAEPDELSPLAVTSQSKGFAELAAGQARAILSSSTGTQESYVRSDGKMSVFTYHFVDALLGRAAAPGASAVTVAQVMDHVGEHVPRTAQAQLGAAQQPFFHYDGTAFPIALVLGGAGIAKGDTSPDPLVVVGANLDIKVLKGKATNVDAEVGQRGAHIHATATLGTAEQGSDFTNVKLKLD